MTGNLKKPLAVVLAADNKSAFALGCVLLSLKENSPLLFNKADFIVFNNDISDVNKTALQKIATVDFRNFTLPFDPKELKTLGIYSIFTMARYELFTLLDEYKEALWLDTDILVQGEVLPVLEYNKNGIALAKDDNVVAANFFTRPRGNFDMGAQNYNVGVLSLSDKLPDYAQIGAWCYEQTKTLAPVLNWMDQAVLNLALQEFKITPGELPRKYNSNPFSSPVKNGSAIILHCAGANKFWNNFPLPAWLKLYNKWLETGGEIMPAQKVNLTLKTLFKLKGFIEKVPFLWAFFVYFNKIRFKVHNLRDLRKIG